jgi:hypothetical protein
LHCSRMDGLISMTSRALCTCTGALIRKHAWSVQHNPNHAHARLLVARHAYMCLCQNLAQRDVVYVSVLASVGLSACIVCQHWWLCVCAVVHFLLRCTHT